MNTGIGFSELILVVVLILVFFGSKELPAFLKKAAQLLATVRRYSNRIKGELDTISQSLDIQPDTSATARIDQKQELRKKYRDIRKSLTPDTHREKSEKIIDLLKSSEEYRSAHVIMIYYGVGSEIPTAAFIRAMLDEGKRVILPYCIPPTFELGIAEIKDVDKDCVPGEFNIPEPVHSLRGKFIRSDVQLIICPGIAFDTYGGRLGNGKGCYDRFISECKGKIPIFALAFDCQITPESLPFEYHDIPMDQIVTESGLLLPYGSNRSPATPVTQAVS
jgi:5-formyltetrahydrofolate cyclo-ligase